MASCDVLRGRALRGAQDAHEDIRPAGAKLRAAEDAVNTTKNVPSRATMSNTGLGTMSAASKAMPTSHQAIGNQTTATKAQRVMLFTDRSLFAQQWAQALSASGLETEAAAPAALPAAVARGTALVIDA